MASGYLNTNNEMLIYIFPSVEEIFKKYVLHVQNSVLTCKANVIILLKCNFFKTTNNVPLCLHLNIEKSFTSQVFLKYYLVSKLSNINTPKKQFNTLFYFLVLCRIGSISAI